MTSSLKNFINQSHNVANIFYFNVLHKIQKLNEFYELHKKNGPTGRETAIK
jgi:hypothetical protein